jgi:ABC-type bacteriocin/lantibiotic exporter with double-glycine peptidase domain
MSSKPPFVAQERPDSCAVACLRMLLAHRGVAVSEEALIVETTLDEGGLTPEEQATLAHEFGLSGEERIVNQEDLVGLVRQGRFPIVYLYRKFIDGPEQVHAVTPVAFTKHFATILDPLRGRRRISIKRFARSRAWVQNWAVVFAEGEMEKQRGASRD